MLASWGRDELCRRGPMARAQGPSTGGDPPIVGVFTYRTYRCQECFPMRTPRVLKVLTVAAALAVGIFLSGPHFAVEGQVSTDRDSASLMGIVLQEGSDQPLPGATLMILETQRSVVTDANGEFSFPELTPGKVVLRAGLDGYASVVESLEVASNEVGFVQLRLPPIFAALDELFVIAERSFGRAGYQEASVRNDDGDLGTAADLLEGKVLGLDLRRNSGSAAGGARVQVRGPNSLFLSNEPVIYVDGIRVSSRFGSLDSRTSVGLHALEMIPASVVERIRVLRGPSAGARYPDANNGVILIETRQGGSGDTDAGRND